MSKEPTSKTEEQINGLPFLPGSPYKTTISDGDKRVEGYGNTSEESQKDASDKWDKAKD